jgi:hypothetical protein
MLAKVIYFTLAIVAVFTVIAWLREPKASRTWKLLTTFILGFTAYALVCVIIALIGNWAN